MISNTYYKDYLSGYININDIPYKYWNGEIISLALKKEPYTYYERLLTLSINKEMHASPEEILREIPEKYRTYRIYKKLLDYDYQRFYLLVPQEYIPRVKTEEYHHESLITNFKNIPEEDRTPAMYKALSKISFEDYLMYVINYHDIPDKYRNKQMCLKLFYSNIDKYVKEIPDEYKSQELCNMLARRNFKKYFSIIPEECRTKEMYEEFVRINPVKNIEEVPKNKRTQAMYDYIFDCGMDNYIKFIPRECRTKEMYHQLIKIKPNKYIGLMPDEFFDVKLAIELVMMNITNLNLIPNKLKNEEFYLRLIKNDPIKYLKLLPTEYYTDEIVTKIGNILLKRKDNHKIVDDLKINKLIIDKFPGLLGKFSDKIIMSIIKEELCTIIANNQSIDIIINKYGLNNKTIINILSKIKEKDIKAYKEINQKIEEHNLLKYTNILEDMKKLETIIVSLGNVVRRKLTSEKKQEIAYLIKKYVYTPLEVIYTYNNSYMKENANEIINHFIEYVLEYSILIDRYEGLTETRKITFENPWLKDFDLVKHFNIIDGKPTSTYKYGTDGKELTLDLAKAIINKLISEEIPLNTLIVSVAFRKYFQGELDNYIQELHNYDNIFIDPKRRKREV